MTNNNHNNHKPHQPPLPTPEVWRALLLIYNHFQFSQELARPRNLRGGQGDIPSQILAAIRLLDCWLDKALQEGWMEGE